MKKLTNLEYLQLGKFKRFLYKFANFFAAIPEKFVSFFKAIWKVIVKLGCKIKDVFKNIGSTFKNGPWQTKLSYLIMGFGNASRGQILRGIFFFLFQLIFILYMVFWGGNWMGQLFESIIDSEHTLGITASTQMYDPVLDVYVNVEGQDSFKILLYSLLTIFFIIAYIVTWYINIKQNKTIDEILATGKKLKSGKDDLHSMVDDQFHKTLLSLPIIGILLFTVLPIIFMVIVAFTNYDAAHDGYSNLFAWVGLDNFNELLTWSSGSSNLSATFGEILGWTLMWAFLATFTNYFLGMFVAMIINKRSIKVKKLWRSVLVLTIAIPQFISLLYVSKIFSYNGLINGLLIDLGIIGKTHAIDFWGNPTLARVMVVLINIWIGIPYLMLISTGILMNIPQDLYESAKIDGANAWQQYFKITLPYMLFVTGPYLLTNFIGNLNNFNVIFLLTGGGPTNPNYLTTGGTAGDTDLLITWLFKITTGAEANYKLASVIGIMIFVVVSVISLIVYNVMPSTKNEEDYS